MEKRRKILIDFKLNCISQNGFTLIELLIVISIIGLIASATMFYYNSARMQARDAMRAGNVAIFRRALALYTNDKNHYPISTGECFSDSGVGAEFIGSNVIKLIPTDPFWPDTPPSDLSPQGYYAVDPSANFCYYYYGANNFYFISYYLETSSNSRTAGVNVITN